MSTSLLDAKKILIYSGDTVQLKKGSKRKGSSFYKIKTAQVIGTAMHGDRVLLGLVDDLETTTTRYPSNVTVIRQWNEDEF